MRAVVGLIILLVFGAVLALAVGRIPMGAPPRSDMDAYYLRHGQEQTGANNIVTSIVFDFRALDTLGEASVLFTAVLGVGSLFRKRREDEDA